MANLINEKFNFNGNELTYFHIGDGTKYALLMHGYNFSTDTWNKVGLIDTLVKKGYDVFSLDMPGFPNSVNKINIPRNEITDLLNQFIDKVLKGKTLLLGASASGKIAIEFANKHSDRLSKLILVDPVDPERGNYKDMGIPVLGVWGENDTISHPIKNPPDNMKVDVIKGAGHASYLDNPTEFNSLITDFV